MTFPKNTGRYALALAAGAFLSALCVSSAAPEDLRSTRDMTALTPAAADHVVRRDLLSTLMPLTHKLNSGMRLRTDEVWLSARPYGTQFVGLCRQDTLQLKYAPVEVSSRPRDQHLQPYGFEAIARFHAVSVPKAPVEDIAMNYIWSSRCDGLAGDENASWFQAKDEEEAARAVNLLAAATEAIRAGKLKPSPCELVPSENRACRDVVADEGKIGSIFTIEACDAPPGRECYRIDLTDFTSLTIVGRSPEDDSLTPPEVESVKVGYYVIVT